MGKRIPKYRPSSRNGQGSGWQAQHNSKNFISVRPRPRRALITGLVRAMAKARDGKRSLTLNGYEVFVQRTRQALKTCLVPGMAKRIPKSLVVRSKRSVRPRPMRSLITRLLRGMAKGVPKSPMLRGMAKRIPNYTPRRSLTLDGKEVFVQGQGEP